MYIVLPSRLKFVSKWRLSKNVLLQSLPFDFDCRCVNMLLSNLLVTLALATFTATSPLDVPHSVHEKRAGPPRGWKKHALLDRRAVLPMRIGLRQSNLEKTWGWLSEVSHPESEKYGQHWSAKEIADTFAPRYYIYLRSHKVPSLKPK